jgi:pimeloyl-ACP methyl ester carboxylesterase
LCPPAAYEDCTSDLGVDVRTVAWLEDPPPHDLPTVAGRVADLATGPVVLFGHSTGGVVAALAAELIGDRLRGIALCDTGAHMRGHGDVERVVGQLRDVWGPEFFAQFLARSVDSLPPEPLRSLLLDYPARIDPRHAVQALRSQQALDVSATLRRLDVPALVLHGLHDVARPVADAERIARLLPDAQLHVLDCGHSPPFERPAEVRALLRDLLARVNQRTKGS